jgi:hypothetical protein
MGEREYTLVPDIPLRAFARYYCTTDSFMTILYDHFRSAPLHVILHGGGGRPESVQV